MLLAHFQPHGQAETVELLLGDLVDRGGGREESETGPKFVLRRSELACSIYGFGVFRLGNPS